MGGMNVKRSDHSASLLLRETKYFVRIKAQKQDSTRILKRILSAVSGEPDISVIYDKNNLSDRGCEGAPDWIIEIVSPSTQSTDYGVKLFKYRTAGVREYWIINGCMHLTMKSMLPFFPDSLSEYLSY